MLVMGGDNMKNIALIALSFTLTGCYGTQIAALRDQVSYMETRASIVNVHLDQLERDIDDAAYANRRISMMVRDMNEYNVCPRQLDRRLQAIEKALRLKKISFTPDWIYRVRAGGGSGDSIPIIWTSTADAVYISTYTIAAYNYSGSSVTILMDADSRQRRSNPYPN